MTEDFHPLIKFLISLLRFVTVSVLAFFLLEPLIKNSFIETEKPIVVLAQDNSESLVTKGDTSFYKTNWPNQLQELSSRLQDDFEVAEFTFGSEVKDGLNIDYSEKQTDFSELFDEIYARYSNRNLGAIILGSDGIFTKGSNPLYAQTKLKAPIYTIAQGDTTKFKDALILEVAHNKLAYLGNKFPIEIVVSANELSGKQTTLKVTKGGSNLFSKVIRFNSSDAQEIVPVILEANSPGLQKYSISISSVSGEVTTKNNYKDIYIDVLDSRQKIVLLAANPHPDLGALKNIINTNENYEVDVFKASDFKGKISDYNLAIFHQMPSNIVAHKQLVQRALEQKVPSLFIWGSKTNFKNFNDLNLGFSLENTSPNSNDVGAAFNKSFKTFKVDDNIKSLLKKLPPLSMPFGNLESSPGVNSLLYQQVGPITTESPLLSFNTKNGVKVGILAGEGIWRWRLFSHLEQGSHEAFDEWFLKSLQYVANKEDKSLFRVSTKSSFDETQRVVFNAELYNDSFEPISNQEITLKVVNEDGEDFPFTFSPSADVYRADIGILPAGNYTYSAFTNSGGKKLSKSGQFSVSPVVLEQLNTQADHNLLFNLAERNDGQMVETSDVKSLIEIIKANSEIVPVSFEKKTLSDLINYKWLLGLILITLCSEWLLRKRNGVY